MVKKKKREMKKTFMERDGVQTPMEMSVHSSPPIVHPPTLANELTKEQIAWKSVNDELERYMTDFQEELSKKASLRNPKPYIVKFQKIDSNENLWKVLRGWQNDLDQRVIRRETVAKYLEIYNNVLLEKKDHIFLFDRHVVEAIRKSHKNSKDGSIIRGDFVWENWYEGHRSSHVVGPKIFYGVKWFDK